MYAKRIIVIDSSAAGPKAASKARCINKIIALYNNWTVEFYNKTTDELCRKQE